MMSPVERLVMDRLKAFLARRLTVCRMVVFGSRARGCAGPESDMDVLVVLEGGAGDEAKDYVSECAWEAGFDHGIVVVPVVFTRDEWENGPERYSLLAQAVSADGVPV
jgi:predicted nucleotidyltransferase